MRKAVFIIAVVMFGLGFAFGKGWLPPDSGSDLAIRSPRLDGPATSGPTYSDLQLRSTEYGSAEGSIVLRNNADEPLTIMATITLYDGDRTVSTLFARADRVKPGTEQEVGVMGGYEPHTEIAVDLAAVP